MKLSRQTSLMALILLLAVGACEIGDMDQLTKKSPELDQESPVNMVKALQSENSVDLLSGQDQKVGTINVSHDANYLYVTYNIDDASTDMGWCLIETHVHVGETLDDFPLAGRWGNPIPGRFDYSQQHLCVTDYTYMIPYEGDVGEFIIAAHAVVRKVKKQGGKQVVSFRQAWRQDGSVVPLQRSNPETVLKFETGRDESNFFSLGFGGKLNENESGIETFFGIQLTEENPEDPSSEFLENLTDTENNAGWIMIEFDPLLGEMSMLHTIEDTWGLPYPPEETAVFTREDGNSEWNYLGIAGNQDPFADIHTETKFELPEHTKYVLLQDVTHPASFSNIPQGDGYDVNAVLGLVPVEEETAWGEGDKFSGKGNWATYFMYSF
ncbi:MAG: hypothetical protein R6U04_00560 [Bacteroidales bacterium]